MYYKGIYHAPPPCSYIQQAGSSNLGRCEMSHSSPTPSRQRRRVCVGSLFCIGLLPLVGLTLASTLWVIANEARAVCLKMAFHMVSTQVHEVSCERNTRNDNTLVHLTCPLHHQGVTDRGTGIHSSGIKMVVTSRMLQWKEVIHTRQVSRSSTYTSQDMSNAVRDGCAHLVMTRLRAARFHMVPDHLQMPVISMPHILAVAGGGCGIHVLLLREDMVDN